MALNIITSNKSRIGFFFYYSSLCIVPSLWDFCSLICYSNHELQSHMEITLYEVVGNSACIKQSLLWRRCCVLLYMLQDKNIVLFIFLVMIIYSQSNPSLDICNQIRRLDVKKEVLFWSVITFPCCLYCQEHWNPGLYASVTCLRLRQMNLRS